MSNNGIFCEIYHIIKSILCEQCIHVVNVATSYTNQCHTYLYISVSTPDVDAPPSPVVEVQPVVVNLAEGNFDF